MANPRALVVDDEPDILQLLTITLSRMRIDSVQASNVTEAKKLLEVEEFDLCLTDMKLPDGDGMELVEHTQIVTPDTPIAIISAHGNMDLAIKALKMGAFDFVSKPIDLPKLRQLVDSALKLKETDAAPKAENDIENLLLGKSPIVVNLRKTISKLARSQAPIYISGESGTGKELVARLIHDQGPRRDGPFIPVNCGAIPSELMESEFFGHKKGSFTGAIADKQGLFQAANGGTLFLDEVADLPLAMQVKLLRAIQEQAIRPIGEEKELPIDVRILSATHKDLLQQVEKGEFRQDLFYRINVISINIPSLRERPDDIAILANHSLKKLFEKSDQPPPALGEAAKQALMVYSFPGNVRELENILERAITLCESGEITPFDLQLPAENESPISPVVNESNNATENRQAGANHNSSMPNINKTSESSPTFSRGDTPLEEYLESIERAAILEALEANRWNKTAAAKDLGISFRAMRYRLKKLDLE